ncbi:sulfate adenylyltransferase, partial [Francisella tularensis subsp. holarctica]|nr:sulfate adenylyltransferase [Francisella tularensis subsp. holarctica]
VTAGAGMFIKPLAANDKKDSTNDYSEFEL